MKTSMTADKLKSILRLLHQVTAIPGAAAEAGVYGGHTLAAIAKCCPERTVYGFDTFGGLPASKWEPGEGHQPGEFGDVNFADVLFDTSEINNIVLTPGIFPQSAAKVVEPFFAFVHVDFDFYQSTKDAIEWFVPRMSPGGVIVFDDYDWSYTKGVRRAIDEAGLKVQRTADYQVAWFAPFNLA